MRSVWNWTCLSFACRMRAREVRAVSGLGYLRSAKVFDCSYPCSAVKAGLCTRCRDQITETFESGELHTRNEARVYSEARFDSSEPAG